MILETGSLDERKLSIYEQDMVNNTEVLILSVYCVRRDNGMWELPAPQIFNKAVYDSNRDMYNTKIQEFRNDCIGDTPTNNSLLQQQIDSLKSENEMLMKALAELANEVSTTDSSN